MAWYLSTEQIFKYSLIAFCFVSYKTTSAQDSIKYEIESQTIGTTGDVVPFWLRSNQFGSIPLSGISQSFIGRAYKDYDKSNSNISLDQKKKVFDWGFGFEGRANIGKGSNLQLIEAYGKIKTGIFQLKAGRSKEVMGLNGDTILSSGNFAVSGNALGVPKIEISIPEYWAIPFLDGIFSIKGNFSHGWIGKTRILDVTRGLDNKIAFVTTDHYPKTYFHQKSFYMKLGKADWKLKFYGGFNHQVFWGNEQAAYGPTFNMSSIETFFYVATGKTLHKNELPVSKIGNQLGSIDVGAEYDFNKIKLMLYRQNFYDVGALSKLANISDGLNGLSIENKYFNSSTKNFKWKKILIEFLYSKDQAGYPWSTPTESGDEDYYNNFYYKNGWSYKNSGIGSPLMTQKDDAKTGQATQEADYFINNRVIAGHLGITGVLASLDFVAKVSYSRNFGTFGTSVYGNSTGIIRNPNPSNHFIPVNQFSLYLEGLKQFDKGISTGFATSIDEGKLLNNSFGILFKLKKAF